MDDNDLKHGGLMSGKAGRPDQQGRLDQGSTITYRMIAYQDK